MAKYTFYVSTKYIKSGVKETIEIPDEELEGMTETEKDDYIYKNYYEDWLANNSDSGWYEEEEK